MNVSSSAAPQVSSEVADGAANYSRKQLAFYDQYVLNFNCKHLWRCPSELLLENYNQHVSSNHLDVGVGTGYFLHSCRFPSASPRIVLADLNPATLDYAAERIRRYAPEKVVANVLEPLPLPPASFDSVGLNLVLHCLPGPISAKAAAIRNLRRVLKDGGVLFGSTVLGRDWSPRLMAQLTLRYFNKSGIFSNREDDLTGLENALRESFRSTSIRLIGGMALFVART